MATVTYPLEGANAVIQSFTSSGTPDLSTMFSTGASASTGAAAPYAVDLAIRSDTLNITSQSATSMANRVGLRSWTATIKGRYPRVARSVGVTGALYLDGGTTAKAFVRSWSLNVSATPMDITSLNQTDKTWRYFRPSKLIQWSGSFDCLVDAANAITITESTDTALTSYAGLKLNLVDEGVPGTRTDDPRLAGSVMLNQLGHSMNMAGTDLQLLRYAFTGSGDLTATSGSTTAAIFPAGPVVTPTWDMNSDGVPDVTALIYVDGTTSRTYSGTCFWTSVQASATPDGLVDLTVNLQGTGPLTVV